jgi:NAD(P)-dependent dehydrogenase (short-subunit alcohol dehydrogenase family)
MIAALVTGTSRGLGLAVTKGLAAAGRASFRTVMINRGCMAEVPNAAGTRASDASSYMTGRVLVIDGGLTAAL